MADDEVRIGAVAEFPADSCRIVTVGRHEVGVFNVDGELYGVRDVCPHRGAPVCQGVVTGAMLESKPGEPFRWGLDGQVLRCPWHRWEFELRTGRRLVDADRSGVAVHAITLRGDDVFAAVRGRVTPGARDVRAS